jgi:tetratricopeptide (TPR) repeat protein
LRRAVAQGAHHAQLEINLAACERMVGALEASERSCNRALVLDPRACQAYYILADLRHWTSADNHIAAMEAIASSNALHWREERYLRFALGKEYQDLERYPAAFRHFEAGNTLQRAHMRYDVSQDVEVIDRIITSHTSRQLSTALAGYESEEPIFVVGLPRTGTSLVERILAAHSAVFSAGELNDFALALLQTAQESGANSKISKLELVERSLSLNMRTLGERYVRRTRPRTGRMPRFVDKLPGNYLYLGLICAALPQARIVMLERDPMDACGAIYTTLFVGTYPFSYDLKDLGTYYLAYRRLADHWVRRLGDRLLVVRYENLVRNFEHEARRLIEFCELPWQDSCSTYYRSAAPATTASAVQVRQPIYTTSIGKWRLYEQQLRPLRSLLQSGGILVE